LWHLGSLAPSWGRSPQEKSYRKYHGFRRDKAISSISNDMHELEESDVPWGQR
jgi:hypothetical protein